MATKGSTPQSYASPGIVLFWVVFLADKFYFHAGWFASIGYALLIAVPTMVLGAIIWFMRSSPADKAAFAESLDVFTQDRRDSGPSLDSIAQDFQKTLDADAERLRNIEDMHRQGLLSDEEYLEMQRRARNTSTIV